MVSLLLRRDISTISDIKGGQEKAFYHAACKIQARKAADRNAAIYATGDCFELAAF